MPHLFYDSAEAYNCYDGNKNNLRTIVAQIVQKLKTKSLGQNVVVLIKKKRIFNKLMDIFSDVFN